MGIIQEKYQTIFPDTEPDPGPWKSTASARRTQMAEVKQILPEGENILDQEFPPAGDFPLVMSGESDVSHDYTAEAVLNGVAKLPMKSTDDQYSREHNDAFYDDLGGFAERNNYLDRE